MAGGASGRTEGGGPRVNAALALAGLGVVLFVVAIVVTQDDQNDWLWPLTGAVGAVAAVMGWGSGRPRPRGQALSAIIIGGLLLAFIVGWVIVAGLQGEL